MSDTTTTAPSGTTTATTPPVEDVNTIKAQLTATAEEAATLKAQIAELNKKFEGVDPADYKKLKSKVKEAQKLEAQKDPAKLEEYQAQLKAEYDELYGSQLDELRSQSTKQAAELKELRLSNLALDKASQIFKKDMLPLIKREILAACDYRDGKVVILGEGKDELRKSPSNPRSEMSIDEFIEELADRYPSAIENRNKPGGMNGADKRSSSPQEIPAKFDSWTKDEQVAFMQKHPELQQRVLNGGI